MIGFGLLEGCLAVLAAQQKVDKKIASRDTASVSVGQGLGCKKSIQIATNAAWIQTKFIDPANVVIWSGSCN